MEVGGWGGGVKYTFQDVHVGESESNLGGGRGGRGGRDGGTLPQEIF